MQSIFSNALSRAVAKHIDLSVTRRETLSWLTLLIMQHGTICLWRLAAYVASMAQTDSVRRRFYRFFQFVRLDSTLAARVVVELLGLGGKPWVLAHARQTARGDSAQNPPLAPPGAKSDGMLAVTAQGR